ncbi:hypothetical protein FSP39_002136 [Pinctada imbricata]|uniref:EF-hand domain-containing protein n=1 Tax=Pinctada imbricata TaxID=66713 RepID=A0AA89BTU2_PINIB|nr:hypothetical protein FSP39_002136 [Pinctada imbricata]
MKGYAILLFLVICLVCISDSDAWRRRRWRRIISRVKKIYTAIKIVKGAAAVVGKRDTEIDNVPANDKCQLAFCDKNNDQKLSEEEIESILQDPEVFGKFDVDGKVISLNIPLSVKATHIADEETHRSFHAITTKIPNTRKIAITILSQNVI